MEKYHKHKKQYIYRQWGKVWHLLYNINTQTVKPRPLPKERASKSLPFPGFPHLHLLPGIPSRAPTAPNHVVWGEKATLAVVVRKETALLECGIRILVTLKFMTKGSTRRADVISTWKLPSSHAGKSLSQTLQESAPRRPSVTENHGLSDWLRLKKLSGSLLVQARQM